MSCSPTVPNKVQSLYILPYVGSETFMTSEWSRFASSCGSPLTVNCCRHSRDTHASYSQGSGFDSGPKDHLSWGSSWISSASSSKGCFSHILPYSWFVNHHAVLFYTGCFYTECTRKNLLNFGRKLLLFAFVYPNFSGCRDDDGKSFDEWKFSCVYVLPNTYSNKDQFLVPVMLTRILNT